MSCSFQKWPWPKTISGERELNWEENTSGRGNILKMYKRHMVCNKLSHQQGAEGCRTWFLAKYRQDYFWEDRHMDVSLLWWLQVFWLLVVSSFLKHYTWSTDFAPFFFKYPFIDLVLCCVVGVERFRKRSCEIDWSGAGEMLRRGRYKLICICLCVCFCFLGVSFQFRICRIVTVTCLVDTQQYRKESSQHNIQNFQITMYNRNIHKSR